ncbi:MAG TPA: hypothetical protein VMZ92_14425 [Planctomycetota bacterium]|nr:hypothetical protein [Planctomycetota bacterium]
MRTGTKSGWVAWLACAVLVVVGCGKGAEEPAAPAGHVEAAGTDEKKAPEDEVKVIGGFEDGTPGAWYGAGAKIAVSDEHATEGKRSLRADLEAGQYPGIGIELRSQDWSKYHVLRFDVYNGRGGTRWFTTRIDAADSKGYSTRFNLEDQTVALRLEPGKNAFEIPIGSLWQGTPESQGIDPTRVKLFRIFFGGLNRPISLYFDNFRLVREAPTGPDRLTIADFDDVPGKVTPSAGTNVSVQPDPEGKGGRTLKLELTPEGNYPGVNIAVPPNWLTYDLLSFNVFCPEAESTPGSMAFKVIDGVGRQQTFSTGLQKGMNVICLPVEAASFTSLGRIRELNLFWGRPNGTLVVYLDDVRLERAGLVSHPSCHNTAAEDDRLAIDFTGLQAGRNTCFMVTAWVPLEAGGYRVVRCNAPSKQQISYGIADDAFEGYAEGKPVRVWAVFLDHGMWFWCETFIPLKPTGQTKLYLDNRTRFGL